MNREDWLSCWFRCYWRQNMCQVILGVWKVEEKFYATEEDKLFLWQIRSFELHSIYYNFKLCVTAVRQIFHFPLFFHCYLPSFKAFFPLSFCCFLDKFLGFVFSCSLHFLMFLLLYCIKRRAHFDPYNFYSVYFLFGNI